MNARLRELGLTPRAKIMSGFDVAQPTPSGLESVFKRDWVAIVTFVTRHDCHVRHVHRQNHRLHGFLDFTDFFACSSIVTRGVQRVWDRKNTKPNKNHPTFGAGSGSSLFTI